MASYGYGYGGGQSQSYSGVQAAGSYPAQSSSGAYASQAHYAPPVSSTPRQMVQQGYDVSSYAPSSSAYGYGRQDQSSSMQSTSYGSYMGRDSGNYDTKSYYSSNSQGASYSGYGSQGIKQSGYNTPASASGMYSSSQVQGGIGHMSKQSQSFMSSNTGSSGYVGYGRQGQTHTSSSGYGSSQGGNQSGNFSSQHTAASSNVSSQHQQQSQQSQQQHKPQPKGVQHANTYETVVYNAATNFLQQQNQQAKGTWQKQDRPQFRLNQNQKLQQRPPFQRQPPKPAQLHYCEVCKISCAGPQTYKEHLDGQRHKKKAASVQTQNKEPVPPGSFRCELCDVTCTGTDAYAAHVKGARHVKTVKLHQKLGKPVPEIKLPATTTVKRTAPETSSTVTQSTTQKINFVGGSKLISTGTGVTESSTTTTMSTTSPSSTSTVSNQVPAIKELMASEESEIVGEEFIENIQSDVGKVIGYKCALCDCRFNDDVARNAHVKGRRHRLNYKKKVNPELKVDIKDNRMRRFGRERDERMNRQMKEKEMMFRQRQEEQMRWERELRMREEELRRWEEEEYMKRVEEDRYWTRPDRQRMMEMEFYEWERRVKFHDPAIPPGGPPQNGGPPPIPSPDDRLIMAKHTAIYPNEAELQQVQNIVAAAEKALKLVSDQIAEEQKPKDKEAKMEVEETKTVEVKTEASTTDETKAEKKTETKPAEKKKPQVAQRFLKGVMRVDVLAKGLLLHERLDVQLVILCADKPTKTMLAKVFGLLPDKVKSVTEEQFDIWLDEAAEMIRMKTTSGPECAVKVKLTSPVMREGQGDEILKPRETQEKAIIDENDVLDKEHCLQALASLRHANWFQARANGVQSCVYIIRIMRDLCNRVPAFQPLKDWAVELLVEKTLSSSPNPLGPGEAFRRVMETLASGVFLPGGPGLLDPCEKEPMDAAANLTDQEREDITAAAQHALRLQAFRQLHKVLGIDPLKPPERRRGHAFGRNKRRHDDGLSGENEVTKIQKKEAEEKIAAAAAAAAAASAAAKVSGTSVKVEETDESSAVTET